MKPVHSPPLPRIPSSSLTSLPGLVWAERRSTTGPWRRSNSRSGPPVRRSGAPFNGRSPAATPRTSAFPARLDSRTSALPAAGHGRACLAAGSGSRSCDGRSSPATCDRVSAGDGPPVPRPLPAPDGARRSPPRTPLRLARRRRWAELWLAPPTVQLVSSTCWQRCRSALIRRGLANRAARSLGRLPDARFYDGSRAASSFMHCDDSGRPARKAETLPIGPRGFESLPLL